ILPAAQKRGSWLCAAALHAAPRPGHGRRHHDATAISDFIFQTAWRTHTRVLATRRARAVQGFPPSTQGKPGARCTRSLVREMIKHTSVVTTGSPENLAFPAQWF